MPSGAGVILWASNSEVCGSVGRSMTGDGLPVRLGAFNARTPGQAARLLNIKLVVKYMGANETALFMVVIQRGAKFGQPKIDI